MTQLSKNQIENRKKWVDALRSGKYKQTSEYLRNKNGYCCLGVACDISGLGKWVKRHGILEEYRGVKKFVTNNGSTESISVLPLSVDEYLGVHTDEGLEERLMKMNDSGEYTFEEIADYIDLKTKAQSSNL